MGKKTNNDENKIENSKRPWGSIQYFCLGGGLIILGHIISLSIIVKPSLHFLIPFFQLYYPIFLLLIGLIFRLYFKRANGFLLGIVSFLALTIFIYLIIFAIITIIFFEKANSDPSPF